MPQCEQEAGLREDAVDQARVDDVHRQLVDHDSRSVFRLRVLVQLSEIGSMQLREMGRIEGGHDAERGRY